MKLKITYLLLLLTSLSGYTQGTFNCSDFDFYNRDTLLVTQYKMHFDSATNSEVKVLDKLVGNIADVTDNSKVDTVLIPRYKIHLSDADTKRLENLILCSIDWLLATNYYDDKGTWSKVEEFVLASHSVSIPIDKKIIVKLESETRQNDLILRYYQLGVIKHITLKSFEPDNNQIQLAGLLALNQYFITNTARSEDIPQIFSEYNKKHDEEVLIKWINGF